MKELHIDTAKIRECGQDIILLSKELCEIIDTMFNRINNINKTTGEWLGDSANLFIEQAMIDKKQYLIMKNQIYSYGTYLIEYANKMENKISEVRK